MRNEGKRVNWEKKENELVFSTDNEMYGLVEIISDNIIHFIYKKAENEKQYDANIGDVFKNRQNLITRKIDAGIFPEVTVCGSGLEFKTGSIKVMIDAAAGKASFYKGSELIMSEGMKQLFEKDVFSYTTGGEKPVVERVKTVDGERNFIKNLKCVKDHKAYRAKYGFDFKPDEGVYGFGQGEEGVYDHRHQNDYLYQHNMRIPMPTFYSDRGYGMLFDCGSLMTFEDDANGSYLFMDTVSSIDYYFIAGENPDKVIDGFRFLTGKAAMLPRWAFGYIQSKEQYYSADEMRDVVKHYRDLDIPLDCVVQDWNSWRSGQWGEKKLDPSRYGNAEERMSEIHSMHAHTMISVWPNMNSTTDDYKELSDQGKILNDLSTYNAFDEQARKIYWKQAKEGLFDKGFDSWWCDSTEPFSGPDWNGDMKREPWERYQMVGGEHRQYLPPEKANLFALEHAKGIYENQRLTTDKKRVLNLTRSGYISGQRFGALLWSGDISANWETLRRQITEGLSMGLSGYPYWTLDIGGFFVLKKNWEKRGCTCNTDSSMKWFWDGSFENGIKDYAYREFYVRFLEFGTFLPVFRSHGTDTPREIWNFGKSGEPFYDAIAKFIRIRYRLMPYIYSLAGAVRLRNETMMRSLLFDFGMDERAKKTDDEFMLGRSFLICPVTKPFYFDPAPADNESSGPFINKRKACSENRICYLPENCNWYDYWTGKKYSGGQEVSSYAPLDRIPVFIREGSVIPMKENMQYAGDKREEPVDIHIYPGCDGHFDLYEDEGDGYGYENGEFSLISLSWSQDKNTLTIGKRSGQYPDMPDTRYFRVILEGEKAAAIEKTVEYTGEEVTV